MKKTIVGLVVLIAATGVIPLTAVAQESADEQTPDMEMAEETEGPDSASSQSEDADADADDADGVDNDGQDQDEDVTEEASGSDATEMISISTEMGVQSVVSGKIPLLVRVTPQVDSSKAQVRWDLPRGLVTTDPVDLWFEMKEGVTREFIVNVEPLSAGNYETVVDVTAWRYDTNYVSSATFRFDIDDGLVVTPAPEEYTRSLMLYRIVLALAALVAIIVAFFAIKFGIKQFKQWLAED